ncbi:MAG: response regulator transcription factor [Elusimicrobiaceae bacterium]|nr:response regulator transcription factor [Elusimicrobiaceae bacterium]
MMKIGLVDDSVILRSAIRNVLESSGYEVVLEAGSSVELFERLEQAMPDVILLDVFFPTENGLDILARLRKQFPKIKVLMVTGLKQETIAEEAKRLGADGILYKPFDTDELLNAIKQA